MKNIKAIDEKIESAEKELAVLKAKRAELKKKIGPKGVKQSERGY